MGARSLARGDLDDAHAGGRSARDLIGDVLTADAGPVLEGEHDGADHRHQQDHPGGLEQVDIACVENPADRLGVADAEERPVTAPE